MFLEKLDEAKINSFLYCRTSQSLKHTNGLWESATGDVGRHFQNFSERCNLLFKGYLERCSLEPTREHLTTRKLIPIKVLAARGQVLVIERVLFQVPRYQSSPSDLPLRVCFWLVPFISLRSTCSSVK